MHTLFCEHCGAARGAHRAFDYHCPVENGFHPTRKFRLRFEKLVADSEVRAAWSGRDPEFVEREVARRVLKQIERALGVLDLSSQVLERDKVLDVLTIVRQGYGL